MRARAEPEEKKRKRMKKRRYDRDEGLLQNISAANVSPPEWVA